MPTWQNDKCKQGKRWYYVQNVLQKLCKSKIYLWYICQLNKNGTMELLWVLHWNYCKAKSKNNQRNFWKCLFFRISSKLPHVEQGYLCNKYVCIRQNVKYNKQLKTNKQYIKLNYVNSHIFCGKFATMKGTLADAALGMWGSSDEQEQSTEFLKAFY